MKKKVHKKDIWKWNVWGYSLLFHKYPKIFLIRNLNLIWQALTPYVTIYLSARVITVLSTSQNQQELFFWIILLLITSAVISIIDVLLKRWRNITSSCLKSRIYEIYNEKLMDLDYADFENSEIYDLYETILENDRGPGYGLKNVYTDVEKMISAIFIFLGGILLTVTLFITPVFDDRASFLNHPIVIGGVIVGFLVCAIAPSFFHTKADQYLATRSKKHILGNKLFRFFGFLGYNNDCAGDVRIYRQDRICDTYNHDKTSIFGSKGVYAKLARGPMGLWHMFASMLEVLSTGFIYVFVCLKALAGAFDIGMATQYIASISQFTNGLGLFATAFGSMKNNTEFIQLVAKFLAIPSHRYQGSLTVEKRTDNDYEIEFRDVSFCYPGSDTYALRHVSFRFPLGKKIAVVGMNGSGKTTFIKLLCRLYEPTEGEILLNGINIQKYDYREYLSIFSIVFQDYMIFAYTLGENVALSSCYDEEKVKQSLQDVGFSKKEEKMPKGLHTYLSQKFSEDGVAVSGGEGQKIAIARALYKDSAMMVFDEPTAALDPVAEADIYERLAKFTKDKTTIYISHRLSSCRFCDLILVFHEGKVIQIGTHQELLRDKIGKYYELWNAQAQYYVSHS